MAKVVMYKNEFCLRMLEPKKIDRNFRYHPLIYHLGLLLTSCFSKVVSGDAAVQNSVQANADGSNQEGYSMQTMVMLPSLILDEFMMKESKATAFLKRSENINTWVRNQIALLFAFRCCHFCPAFDGATFFPTWHLKFYTLVCLEGEDLARRRDLSRVKFMFNFYYLHVLQDFPISGDHLKWPAGRPSPLCITVITGSILFFRKKMASSIHLVFVVSAGNVR
ncbi:hypothetical protein DFH11DRAFT_1548200 [Phellopilus nigrolimitatus]|nr:hypothetical protein DFH11DRAFT_1548200 [Phellopilus nigrolimitatus]